MSIRFARQALSNGILPVSEEEMKEHLKAAIDDLPNVQPATRAQIGYVFVLGKQLGYSPEEIKEWDFTGMSKQEISGLIGDLKDEQSTGFKGSPLDAPVTAPSSGKGYQRVMPEDDLPF